MPRPPKHVSPDTLGGRIRAARERLHLSLARVAADRYSTSLISQIERNRVEPSHDSLQFLAEQLQLPLEDLEMLAKQQRETEFESRQYKVYEERRLEALQAFTSQRLHYALDILQPLNLSQVPSELRWRIAALRAECYFALREFVPAHRDFMYAMTEMPDAVAADQQLEAMTLHLHLAATLRELKQLDAASDQYHIALDMMHTNTALNYIAEAHWGVSLVAFESANLSELSHYRDEQLQIALEHAQNACILYRSIGEKLRHALLACQVGLIEQAQGKLDDARHHWQHVLHTWMPQLDKQLQIAQTNPTEKRRTQEIANVISAVACSLAGIELEAQQHEEALIYVQQAREAGKHSYILRRAEAETMLGRILEAIDPKDPQAEKAFRQAIRELAPTDRIAARIRAYEYLGRHLLNKGEKQAGEEALNQALRLSHVASTFSSSTISADSDFDDIT